MLKRQKAGKVIKKFSVEASDFSSWLFTIDQVGFGPTRARFHERQTLAAARSGGAALSR